MRRSVRCRLLLVALIVTASACGDSSTTSLTSVTAPTSGGITDTFTGTLTVNGIATFPFPSSASGPMFATLILLAPVTSGNTTLPVGLRIGVQVGTSCLYGTANDKAVQGTGVQLFANDMGTWCVQIYDAMGTLTANSETYQIDVTHP
jgi:hypothetical protein